MGIKINAQENSQSKYVKSVKEMGKIIMDRSTSALKQSEFLYSLSLDYQKEKKALKYLHHTTDEVIRKRREELLNEEKKSVDVENIKKKKLAFLDLLLKSTIDGNPLSNTDIREEVDTFMFEGHDTTSSAMTSVLLCLANHPEVQERAYKEVFSIFPEEDKAANYEDLQNMKYLEMVIKEAMRLFPPVPAFTRNVDEDFEFGLLFFFYLEKTE